MSFLNPAFLYGLLALAIPVIIHLFHFRKVRKVYFSNTQFLQSVKKVSQSKLKLKHYLILAARLLFVLFLVLTFAQPYLPSASGFEQAQLVDIYLDNSYSMSNQIDEEEGLTGLDAAVQTANEIVSSYPTGTRFRLLTNNFESASQYYASQNVISDRLTEVGFNATSRSLSNVFERLKILPQEVQNQKRDIFLLSDFQKNAVNEVVFEQQIDSLEQVYLLPLTYAQSRNIYVDSVFLEEPLIFTTNRNTINAVLANAGQQSIEEMPVVLSVNGVQVSNAMVSIPAKGQNTISFRLNFPLQQFNRGVITFDDYPVTFDNEFYFVVREAGKVRIIEIKEQLTTTPVGRVFADTSYFNFSSYQAANVNYGALNEADLIVLNGLSSMNQNLQAALLDYKESGGSLFLVPAKEGFPESASFLTGGLAFQPSAIQNPVRLAPIEENNPFFEDIFEDQQEGFDMPRARAVVSWTGNRENILQLQTGNPFLSRSQDTYVLAAPLEDDFTSFHQHALFVPLLYKIAFNSLEVSNSLYQTTDQNIFSIQADNLQPDKVYKLRKGDQEFIPNQYLYGRSLQLELPSYTLEPGFYELVADDEPIYLTAFNHPRQESKLDQFPLDQLETIVENNQRLHLLEGTTTTSTAQAGFGEKFKGEALWKWTLLLALLSLLAEVLLIRFWK